MCTKRSVWLHLASFRSDGAAKSALEYYSRTLATERAPNGIRVNVVSPGVISTPGSAEFTNTTPGFSSDDWIRNIPLGRLGGTEDIAELVALLASDRGKFITGANYRVDGGMTVRLQRALSSRRRRFRAHLVLHARRKR
jgi:NAD(P)-dependent dehydrogenase (short-subunit alcohol dehydrogenase family)